MDSFLQRWPMDMAFVLLTLEPRQSCLASCYSVQYEHSEIRLQSERTGGKSKPSKPGEPHFVLGMWRWPIHLLLYSSSHPQHGEIWAKPSDSNNPDNHGTRSKYK